MSKIQRIEIIPIEIKLKEPFVISKGALTHAKNTVIIIHDEDGAFGTGECCPYRSIHGETQAGTIAFAKDLAAVLIGEDAHDINKHVNTMNKMIVGNASVKCAFDMALYDLAAKKANLPLYKYLHGNNHKKIITDNTISLLSVDEMVAKAVQFVEQGFRILKVKLGQRTSHMDVERMKSIRKAIGDQITLRIDANQGWNYQDALYALNNISDLNIEHCEEPLPASNLIDQIRLTKNSPIPIMADEAVFNHQDAYRIIASKAAHLFNIKLGKAGGIHNAMKIAAIAEAADIYCQVGSFSESRLGITALVHFDLAWDHILFHDLDSPLMLSEDPVIGGMKYSDEWQVTVDDSPGHGAQFDEQFLKRFEMVKVER
jgi:L-alanine-DL-glutamate epimerase-like enolase superfamily enzyme